VVLVVYFGLSILHAVFVRISTHSNDCGGVGTVSITCDIPAAIGFVLRNEGCSLSLSLSLLRSSLFPLAPFWVTQPSLQLAACQHGLLSWNTIHVGLEGTDTVTPIKVFQKDPSMGYVSGSLSSGCATSSIQNVCQKIKSSPHIAPRGR